MFELFAMGLNEYWSESNAEDAAESVGPARPVLGSRPVKDRRDRRDRGERRRRR